MSKSILVILLCIKTSVLHTVLPDSAAPDTTSGTTPLANAQQSSTSQDPASVFEADGTSSGAESAVKHAAVSKEDHPHVDTSPHGESNADAVLSNGHNERIVTPQWRQAMEDAAIDPALVVEAVRVAYEIIAQRSDSEKSNSPPILTPQEFSRWQTELQQREIDLGDAVFAASWAMQTWRSESGPETSPDNSSRTDSSPSRVPVALVGDLPGRRAVSDPDSLAPATESADAAEVSSRSGAPAKRASRRKRNRPYVDTTVLELEAHVPPEEPDHVSFDHGGTNRAELLHISGEGTVKRATVPPEPGDRDSLAPDHIAEPNLKEPTFQALVYLYAGSALINTTLLVLIVIVHLLVLWKHRRYKTMWTTDLSGAN